MHPARFARHGHPERTRIATSCRNGNVAGQRLCGNRCLGGDRSHFHCNKGTVSVETFRRETGEHTDTRTYLSNAFEPKTFDKPNLSSKRAIAKLPPKPNIIVTAACTMPVGSKTNNGK